MGPCVACRRRGSFGFSTRLARIHCHEHRLIWACRDHRGLLPASPRETEMRRELESFEADEEEDLVDAMKKAVDSLAGDGFRDETRKIGKDRWLTFAAEFLGAWHSARAARAEAREAGDEQPPF